VVNVAITMAQLGQKVLLIDGDLRRPVISKLFGVEQIPGLTDVILGNFEWNNVVRSITDLMMGKMSIEDIMKTPGLDNLHIITSGTYSPNPAELINSKAIGEFMDSIREEYDVVVIDAPPVLAATDAALWSSHVDATVMVYQVGKIARGALKRSKVSLENLNAHVIGVVLNGLKAEISPDFGYQDYYYYYYGREKTPATLHEKIKAKILTGPQSIWHSFVSVFRKKTDGASPGEEPTPQEKENASGETARMAIPAKMDDIKATDAAPRKKKVRRAEREPRPWLKILAVVLLALLLALGVLYQLGYIRQQVDIKPSHQKPTVSQSLPARPPQGAEFVKPAEAQPVSSSESTRAANASPETEKPFSIQVKAVATAKEADEIVQALKAKGEDAFTRRVNIIGRGAWSRIYIGRFADRSNALAFMREERLEKKYPGSMIQNTLIED
jgi:capsular exopolysaccharide synthesis family protein